MRRVLRLCTLLLATVAVLASVAPARAQATIDLRIVGGLSGLNQSNRHERPFWTETLRAETGGRVVAEVVPFDRSGIRAGEALRLSQLGVVPFGTVLLAVAGADDPLLAAPDLSGLHADMAALRRTVAAFRPALARRLREKHGVELLAIYSYPAQVVFCKAPFARLADLAGRRVRTSSVSQADFVQALGATPVTTGFAELVPQFQAGTLDCAITGTMSGNAIGLHELSSHVGALPVNFGLSAFVANVAAWEALPADVRATIQRGLARVEQAIWDESDRETPIGLACNTGGAPCVGGRPGRMTLVPVHPDDDRLRRELFAAQVLPRWVARCGADCAGTWNGVLAPVVGVPAPRP